MLHMQTTKTSEELFDYLMELYLEFHFLDFFDSLQVVEWDNSYYWTQLKSEISATKREILELNGFTEEDTYMQRVFVQVFIDARNESIRRVKNAISI